MERVLVIGDIHGQAELLEAKLQEKGYDPFKDLLIILGDLFDRGYDSKGVYILAKALVEKGAVILRGNHCKMMLDSLNGDFVAEHIWLANGGLKTLESFNPYKKGSDKYKKWRLNYREHLKEIKVFLESRPLFYELSNYIFVHAGVMPGVSLANQNQHDLIWIRDEFLYYKSEPVPGKIVVFGHTLTDRIRGHEKVAPWYAPGRIGIDTGA